MGFFLILFSDVEFYQERKVNKRQIRIYLADKKGKEIPEERKRQEVSFDLAFCPVQKRPSSCSAHSDLHVRSRDLGGYQLEST